MKIYIITKIMQITLINKWMKFGIFISSYKFVFVITSWWDNISKMIGLYKKIELAFFKCIHYNSICCYILDVLYERTTQFSICKTKYAKVYIFEIMFCDRYLISLSNKSSCSENNFFLWNYIDYI